MSASVERIEKELSCKLAEAQARMVAPEGAETQEKELAGCVKNELY